jgi:hypothetical protein
MFVVLLHMLELQFEFHVPLSHVRCKKYPSMELRGLFQYLINQLKKGSGTELVLLEVRFSLKFPVIVAFPCFFSLFPLLFLELQLQ